MKFEKPGFKVVAFSFMVLTLGMALSSTSCHKDTNAEETHHFADNRRTEAHRANQNLEKAYFTALQSEVDACNRLHLSKKEKADRLKSYEQRAEAERLHVKASQYQIQFQAPPTD